MVFHPKSTVVSVENFIKEKANGKSTSEASSQIRQGYSERKGLVGKAKEDKEQQKIISLEDTSDEVSSSYGLKREDKVVMKKMYLMTILVCTLLNGCAKYDPIIDTKGKV